LAAQGFFAAQGFAGFAAQGRRFFAEQGFFAAHGFCASSVLCLERGAHGLHGPAAAASGAPSMSPEDIIEATTGRRFKFMRLPPLLLAEIGAAGISRT
jgi:hypothetical protein